MKDDDKAVNLADDLSQSDADSLSQSLGETTTSTQRNKTDGTHEQMRALFRSRVAVGFLLVVLTTAAGLTTFFVSRKTQEGNLESRVSHSYTVGRADSVPRFRI